MSAAANIELLLDRAEREGAVLADAPPDAEELAEVRAEIAMPRPLAALYERADGLSLPQIDLFDLGDFADVNGDESLFEQLPGVIFIGSDRGDGFFLLDPEETLGCGAGAVYWADRGILEPDACRLAAPALEAFLAAALDGKRLNEGREVGTLSLDLLTRTIAARPDAVTAYPGLGETGAMMAARKRDIPIPFGLSDFYARYDGLYLPQMDLRIFGVDEVGAIKGDDAVIALWLGEDRAGRRYGLTIGGWRGFPANRLFVVKDESELATAATLGRFTDVLRAWIEASPAGHEAGETAA